MLSRLWRWRSRPMLTPRHSCRLQHRLRTWQPRRRPMLMLRWAELLGTLCEGWMSLAAAK